MLDSLLLMRFAAEMKLIGLFVVLLTAFLTVCGTDTAYGGTIYEPALGTPLRKQILDSVRPRAQHELGGSVEFVVVELRVMDGFCFVRVDPQRPGGKKIQISETIYAREQFMDGLQTTALLKLTSGRWLICEWVVGPTDVAWGGWHRKWKLPAEFLGLPED